MTMLIPASNAVGPETVELLARAVLSREVVDFVAGGAGDEVTLRQEREVYERFVLEPRILTGVTQPNLETTLLGTRLSHPVCVAPMAYHRLVCPAGELATVAGAAGTGALTVVAALSSESMENVAATAQAPLWFQLYCLRDRALTASLVHRAAAAGYRAIVLTVDAPRLGQRWRDHRNGFSLPPEVVPANLVGAAAGVVSQQDVGTSALAEHADLHHDASLSWDDIAWFRSLTGLPIVLKGVLSAADAVLAADAGVDGIIVSSHGGRQLDRVAPALAALPAVVDAVGHQLEVYLDGGVRRGADALTALGLGARAVFVGRPIMWGLAADGPAGVESVLARIRDELSHAMVLAGGSCIDDLIGLVRPADDPDGALARRPAVPKGGLRR
ncbi:alpha-hydroxy acid oxidase [Streptomyces chartreusis]|uniref:alpha-hydroxy acid oxidase n=1 Tax=Streptomyces chartreusis TaxID=1969 RepID=UPI00369735FD